MDAVSPTIFFIDGSRNTGLQSQIRETTVSAILSGAVLPGARMPSTRGLADYLKVSRLTVTLAYQELVSQGYLEVRSRSAYHVATTPPISHPDRDFLQTPNTAVDWSSKLRPGFNIAKTIRKPLDWRKYRYPFLYGQMDQTLFDLAAWRDCARRALAREDFILMAGDFAAADDVELVNYICSRTLPSRGIRAEQDEILVTVGAQNALWIISHLLLTRRSHVVCENPGHPDISATLHLTGARVTALDVDEGGLPPELLPDGIDAVFVTPSHQSPTAATMPRARRIALLEAAAERDFVIVEDDYEFEMSFLQPPTPALKSLDQYGRVLYVGSFSKSLFPGLRLGYLVAPAPVIREARALRALMLRHPPGHLQRTAAYFLALGHYDAVIHRMRIEYHKRHIAMIEALDREGLKIAGKSAFGGTAFWIEGPEGMDADKLARDLREDGVLIESGAPFFWSDDRPCRYFRIAYSSIPLNRIAEGIELLAKRMRKISQFRNG
ncbi:PLP-dependent aminotransferase family protein [Brucella intermedia]|uniref:MocR-like pyridoxine biosynthesis transcription factor PdxR n=1 Tax=Brucella intermedia TaxID=94625 RepID=UPI00124D988C|nr:PLP-dependent aminotransferase family protein [Brucella intermedia]KAB2717111.1 PLP-dependent aminotransferase family protein [Brucella intermedia]